MKLVVRPSKLAGTIAVPGSKSHTIRGVVAALQSSGRCVLRAPLSSEDTRSTLEAARGFGATAEEYPDRWEITGVSGNLRNPGKTVNMNNSGTGLRLLTALAATQNFPISFDGDNSLRSRPMTGLFGALELLGAKIESRDGKCPFTIHGPIRGGETEVDGKSSQYLTALLMTLPRLECDSVVRLNYLFEQPYAEITARWLDALRIRYRKQPDLLKWEIPGGQKFPTFDRVIPADFSTACFPLAAGALCGGAVEIRNLDFTDAQGDKKVFDFLEEMGGCVERGKQVTVRGGNQLHGTTLDLNATPDALPVLAATAAFAEGETRLVNVAQARNKETDRISAMAEELRKMGVETVEYPDGLMIRGGKPRGATVDSRSDHRLAMALAVAGMRAEGETVIEHAEGIAVTYPDFIRDFQRLGANFSVTE